MISLEETGRDFKTMSSLVHLSSSARREIAQGLFTRASGRTRLKLRLHCFFAIDLLAANCPASVTSVRQLLSRRRSNHTVYGDPEGRRFTAFNFARLDRRNSLSTQDAAGRERQEFCSEMRPCNGQNYRPRAGQDTRHRLQKRGFHRLGLLPGRPNLPVLSNSRDLAWTSARISIRLA